MPKRRERAELAVGRFLIEAFRASAETIIATEWPASSCGDVLIGIAIWIAQKEGRPLTAAKLADYIGMPRPTVIRRLNELMAAGIVVRDEVGRWITGTQGGNDKKVQGVIDANLLRFHRTCEIVSKLDKKPVAVPTKRAQD
jgi:DNA-binding transcriptional ArsR family regulator